MVHCPVNSSNYFIWSDACRALVNPSLQLGKLVSEDQDIFWINVGEVSTDVLKGLVCTSEVVFVIALIKEVFNLGEVVICFINERLSDFFPNAIVLSRHARTSR